MSKKSIPIYKEYHPSEVDSQEASKIAIQEKLLRRQSLTVTLVASISEEDLSRKARSIKNHYHCSSNARVRHDVPINIGAPQDVTEGWQHFVG